MEPFCNRGPPGAALSIPLCSCGEVSRIRPFAEACYADPFLDGHNRMKVALQVLGRIDAAHVRPPLQAVTDSERNLLRGALGQAGIRG